MLCVWYQPAQSGSHPDDQPFKAGLIGGNTHRPDEEEDKELERLLNLAKARATMNGIREKEKTIDANRIENLETARAQQAQNAKQLGLEKAAQQFGLPMVTRESFNNALGIRQQQIDAPKAKEKQEDIAFKRAVALDKANKAKEAEKLRQEEIAKQRLKNLAKARRTQAKNRGKQ